MRWLGGWRHHEETSIDRQHYNPLRQRWNQDGGWDRLGLSLRPGIGYTGDLRACGMRGNTCFRLRSTRCRNRWHSRNRNMAHQNMAAILRWQARRTMCRFLWSDGSGHNQLRSLGKLGMLCLRCTSHHSRNPKTLLASFGGRTPVEGSVT